MSKSFEFSRKGLEESRQYKDYKGIIKEKLEDHPEVFPIALGVVVIAAALIASPGASIVAYKSGVDVAEVAFKYMNCGGL